VFSGPIAVTIERTRRTLCGSVRKKAREVHLGRGRKKSVFRQNAGAPGSNEKPERGIRSTPPGYCPPQELPVISRAGRKGGAQPKAKPLKKGVKRPHVADKLLAVERVSRRVRPLDPPKEGRP